MFRVIRKDYHADGFSYHTGSPSALGLQLALGLNTRS